MNNDQRRRAEETSAGARDAFERALDDIFGPAYESADDGTAPEAPEQQPQPVESVPVQTHPEPTPHPSEPVITAPTESGRNQETPQTRTLRRFVTLGCLGMMLLFSVCIFGPLLFGIITSSETSSGPEPVQELVPASDLPNGSVPFGEGAELGDSWVLRVDEVIHDATQMVLDENSFNDPPVAGRQYLIATVTLLNRGDEPRAFDATFRLRLRGANSGLEYLTFDDSSFCGVVPDRFPESAIEPGEQLTGNLCWGVQVEDLNSLILYSENYDNQEREIQFKIPPPLVVGD